MNDDKKECADSTGQLRDRAENVWIHNQEDLTISAKCAPEPEIEEVANQTSTVNLWIEGNEDLSVRVVSLENAQNTGE